MLREIETQQTINGITILDTTNEVVNDSGEVVETWFDLTIIGADLNGKPRAILFQTHYKMRHLIRKERYIKKFKNEYVCAEELMTT